MKKLSIWKGRNMKKIISVVVVVVVLLSQGCCSVFCSDTQTISVGSEPPGAKVQVGPHEGKTPYQVTIPRGKEYLITANYLGKTKTQHLTKSIEGIYWINILLWPGLIIDLATGKMFNYEPNVYNFSFE